MKFIPIKNKPQLKHQMKEAIDWLQNLFEIDNNATATIIITITVFLIGLILQGIYQLIRNYIKRQRHRRMFIHLLQETSKASYKQGEFFLALVNTLNIEYIGHYNLTTATLGYCKQQLTMHRKWQIRMHRF